MVFPASKVPGSSISDVPVYSFIQAASPLPSQGEWNRKVTREEYNRVLEYLEEFNIRDGYIQELPGEEDPLPDFSRVDAFPPDLAKHLWSWTKGLVEK
jgi:hypothetical protein